MTSDAVDAARSPDARLRRRVFWAVIFAAVAAGAVGRWVQGAHRYPLNSRSEQTGGFVSQHLHHGSYGSYLAEYDIRGIPEQTVIMLGNSVYLNCGIVSRIQYWANGEQRRLQFVNLAQPSAGVHDFLVHLADVAAERPALVVVSFLAHTFSEEFSYGPGRRYALPRFRTDVDQTVFEFDRLAALPRSFYLREFTLHSAGSSLMSSAVPLKRLDWILRRDLRGAWTDLFGIESLPNWYVAQFRLPVLNDRGDVAIEKVPVAEDAWIENELAATALPTLKELLNVAEAHDVPLLFIRQAAGPADATPNVVPLLSELCAGRDRMRVVDHTEHYDAEELPDQVHPQRGEARRRYAKRHYEAIIAMLEDLGAQPPPFSEQRQRVIIEAELYDRGAAVINWHNYGPQIGTVLSRGDVSAEIPTFAEYDIDVPRAGRYLLRLRWAAQRVRPITLSVNGATIGPAADTVTGGWTPQWQRWGEPLTIELRAGVNTLRLESAAPFPCLDKLSLEWDGAAS